MNCLMLGLYRFADGKKNRETEEELEESSCSRCSH
jgi:hypothetical protein